MTTKVGVMIMALLLALYLGVTLFLAVLFIASGRVVGILVGVLLIVLALIGAWALVREMLFGMAATRLGGILDAEGGMPTADGERTPSGRIARDAVAPLIEQHVAAAETSPQEWRTHYRLGVVYEAAGQRKNARAALRRAIAVSRANPATTG